MNYAKRHKYYVSKTVDHFTNLNLLAEIIETNYTIWAGNRLVHVKRDIWGADIIARGTHAGILFAQVKTSLEQIRNGVKQLSQDDSWPAHVRRFVIYWPPRSVIPHGLEVLTGNEGRGATRPFPEVAPDLYT